MTETSVSARLNNRTSYPGGGRKAFAGILMALMLVKPAYNKSSVALTLVSVS